MEQHNQSAKKKTLLRLVYLTVELIVNYFGQSVDKNLAKRIDAIRIY